MQRVPTGYFVPFQPAQGDADGRWVLGFWLDERPVTNAEFLAFVREHPRWRRSRVSPRAADAAYLSHWAGDLELGATTGPQQPVTFVSWFAARSYCRARGARLPTEAEWEWAALPAGSGEQAAVRERSFAFFGRPRRLLPDAGASAPNRYGLRDQHGVVFEWIADLPKRRTASAARRQDELARGAFCGGGAAGAADVRDYAAFVRHALRASLEPRFALHHLGFRCARSVR